MTAWGKIIATTGSLANTVGANQPFRYRGYVYDEETGFYYLQSRYYDPTTCRFISADVLLSTGQGVIGHNSFVYCLNSPVVKLDSQGTKGNDNPNIYSLIKKNVQWARRYRILISVCIFFASLNPYYRTVSIGLLILSKYAVFYANVKQNGKMDYKNQTRWKQALPNLKYPGNDGEDPTYWLFDRLISASDLGNINYGAVGAALGIPLDILLWQAGAAQLRKPVSEGGEGYSFLYSFIEALKRGKKGYYGDQKDDYYSIIRGFELYYRGYFT